MSDKDPVVAKSSARSTSAEQTAQAFAARLWRARQGRGLTLREVAIESGVSIAYLSDLERAKLANPTLDKLRAIAEALGVSLDALVGGDEPSTQEPKGVLPDSLEAFINSPAFQQAVGEQARRWRRVDSEVRDDWVRLLAGLQVAGRRPARETDWLFVFEAVRRAVES